MKNLTTIVFPTGVGMNRDLRTYYDTIASVPHGRGDEPVEAIEIAPETEVFPTGVGMNRPRGQSGRRLYGVPHGRRDEPTTSYLQLFIFACSPRAWG